MRTDDERREDAVRDYGIIGTPPEPNFDRITKLTATIFQRPVCTLSFLDQDRFWFKSKFGIDATEMPRGSAFCSETIRGEHVFTVPDALLDPRFQNAPAVVGPFGFRFYAGAPLLTPSGDCVGALCILDVRPNDPLSDVEERILLDLAATAVELLEARTERIALARGAAQTAFLAAHDALTGLGNRRSLDMWVNEPYDGSHLGFLYLDLDGFKRVNDEFGHSFGDIVLQKVAERLRIGLPEDARAARLGGDEFAVIVRGGDCAALTSMAQDVARHLIQIISEPYRYGDTVVTIGVSIGITVRRRDGELTASLRMADDALYAAKRAGRGRFHIAEGMSVS